MFFGLSAVMYRNFLSWRPFAVMYYLRAFELPLQLACFGLGFAAMSGHFGPEGYNTYIFPGLIVLYLWFATIMESTYTTFIKAFTHHLWEGMVLTPVKLSTVILGEQLLCLFKSMSLTLLFFVAGIAFGVVPSIPGMFLGLIPLAAMTLCIISLGHLMCGWARIDYDFDPLWPLLGTPMMLASDIFYPVSTLPSWVQKAVWLSPLYHGVQAFRPLTAGNFTLMPIMLHTSILLAGWLIFTFLATRRFHQRIYV